MTKGKMWDLVYYAVKQALLADPYRNQVLERRKIAAAAAEAACAEWSKVADREEQDGE